MTRRENNVARVGLRRKSHQSMHHPSFLHWMDRRFHGCTAGSAVPVVGRALAVAGAAVAAGDPPVEGAGCGCAAPAGRAPFLHLHAVIPPITTRVKSPTAIDRPVTIHFLSSDEFVSTLRSVTLEYATSRSVGWRWRESHDASDTVRPNHVLSVEFSRRRRSKVFCIQGQRACVKSGTWYYGARPR